MIADKTAREEVQKNWAGVEALRKKLVRSAFASTGVVGGTFPSSLADAAHNLPFIHVSSVLNNVLEQLASEGHFTCKSHFLGALLEKSEKAIPWRDFDQIRKGLELRNKIAHKALLLDRGECWKHIDAIKAELEGWGLV